MEEKVIRALCEHTQTRLVEWKLIRAYECVTCGHLLAFPKGDELRMQELLDDIITNEVKPIKWIPVEK